MRWLRRPLGRRWTVVGVSAALIVAALLAGGGTAWGVLMLAVTAVAGTGIAIRAVAALRVRQVGIELLVTIAVLGAWRSASCGRPLR